MTLSDCNSQNFVLFLVALISYNSDIDGVAVLTQNSEIEKILGNIPLIPWHSNVPHFESILVARIKAEFRLL